MLHFISELFALFSVFYHTTLFARCQVLFSSFKTTAVSLSIILDKLFLKKSIGDNQPSGRIGKLLVRPKRAEVEAMSGIELVVILALRTRNLNGNLATCVSQVNIFLQIELEICRTTCYNIIKNRDAVFHYSK